VKTISGRYCVMPAVEAEELVEACNKDAELTVQTANAMAQKWAGDEGESFVVAQIVRVVNPPRERCE
jgi:hypothetical protein